MFRLSSKCAGGSMDRASDSGSEGWGFESLPACQKDQIPFGIWSFCIPLEKGTRIIKSRCPVGICLPPAGRRQHHTLHLWCNGNEFRLRCPIKSSGLRVPSILSTAAHAAPSLFLPPAALGLAALPACPKEYLQKTFCNKMVDSWQNIENLLCY